MNRRSAAMSIMLSEAMADNWVPDELVKNCEKCNMKFSFLNRRVGCALPSDALVARSLSPALSRSRSRVLTTSLVRSLASLSLSLCESSTIVDSVDTSSAPSAQRRGSSCQSSMATKDHSACASRASPSSRARCAALVPCLCCLPMLPRAQRERALW